LERSQGARNQTSHSSSVRRITGMALGWMFRARNAERWRFERAQAKALRLTKSISKEALQRSLNGNALFVALRAAVPTRLLHQDREDVILGAFLGNLPRIDIPDAPPGIELRLKNGSALGLEFNHANDVIGGLTVIACPSQAAITVLIPTRCRKIHWCRAGDEVPSGLVRGARRQELLDPIEQIMSFSRRPAAP
jgi:hypothetical protein